ncbi:MAG: MAPEG family protein [Burkholderiaceae bacterium]|nr:MAPEG family protein [Burkholderiaceae bacterium]
MSTPSAIALTAFIAWTLLLLTLMEVIRSQLVLRGKVPANGFTPDNTNLSPFMQRLARAHANCLENLPIFGGLLLIAIATGHTSITDPLAYLLLGVRVFQSLVHLASVSALAVTIRFTAFAVQMAICLYWAFKLLVIA